MSKNSLNSRSSQNNQNSTSKSSMRKRRKEIEKARRKSIGNENTWSPRGSKNVFEHVVVTWCYAKRFSGDLRQQSDAALIACVQEDAGHHSYFSRPPLTRVGLVFEDSHIESDYRLEIKFLKTDLSQIGLNYVVITKLKLAQVIKNYCSFQTLSVEAERLWLKHGRDIDSIFNLLSIPDAQRGGRTASSKTALTPLGPQHPLYLSTLTSTSCYPDCSSR